MAHSGPFYTLVVSHDGPPLIYRASVKALRNKLARDGGSIQSALRNMFSVRFVVAKYKSTTNKTDFRQFLDLDMLDSAIETGHAICEQFNYTLTYCEGIQNA